MVNRNKLMGSIFTMFIFECQFKQIRMILKGITDIFIPFPFLLLLTFLWTTRTAKDENNNKN